MSPRHSAPEPNGVEYFEIQAVEPVAASQSFRDGPIEATAIVAVGVHYARAGRIILDDVSVTAEPGQALAVVGPSGSGKSSLLALLAGLERPDAGSVRRCGASRDGLILQGYGLASVLTAAENVEVPLQAGVLGRLDPGEVRDRAGVLLEQLGLSAVADHLVEELSGGQQQRVAVARALAVDPSVVFADELTAELDHAWKERVVGMVLDVARRGGVVVIATHDPKIAARCDRVVALTDGRVA